MRAHTRIRFFLKARHASSHRSLTRKRSEYQIEKEMDNDETLYHS